MLEITPGRAEFTKLDAAREAAGILLANTALEDGDQVAVVSFGEFSTVHSDLSSDREFLQASIRGILATPLTCILCGLKAADSVLNGRRHVPDHNRVVVLLTDGISNPAPVEHAITFADTVKAGGVVVFTVGLGKSIDEDALRSIASSGDRYFYAASASDLNAIYKNISGEVKCIGAKFLAGER